MKVWDFVKEVGWIRLSLLQLVNVVRRDRGLDDGQQQAFCVGFLAT
jgi:hypothetical protein